MIDKYNTLSGLEHIYLEDSYVLGIYERSQSLEFNLEAVLTEDHNLYHSPQPSEQYCYRSMKMTFTDVSSIEWLVQKNICNKDPDGSVDFGNIDSFMFDEESYTLSGDWGEVRILGGTLLVDLQ